MGTQFVDGSPGLGSIFTNLAGAFESAPGKALDNIAKAEQIKNARIARQREEEQYGLTQGLLGTVEGAVPVAQAKPTTTVGPYTGTLSDAAGLPTATFIDPRMQAAAEARRAAAVAGTKATLFKDPSQWSPQLAYSEVASAGVPERADERARIQFATTGKFPTSEETKVNAAHNMAVYGPDNKPTGEIVPTQNYQTDLNGRPLSSYQQNGNRLVAAGAADATAPNPMKDAATALERLNVLRTEIDPAKGPTPEQALQVQQLTDVVSPWERKVEKIGDRDNVLFVRSKQLPQWIAAMQPAATAQAAPAAPAVPAAPEQLGDPALLAPAAAAAPPAPAAAVAPIVDLNADRVVSQRPGSAIELRKEAMQQPAIKTYAEAVPNYNTMVKAAQGDVENGLLPDSSSDLNIIYAVAKLFDPGSVVRESELKLAQGTAPIADMLQAAWSKAITGEGMMTSEMRANLIHQGQIRMEQYRVAKNQIHNQFTELANKTGVDPAMVVPQLPDMLPYNRDAIINPTISGRTADDIINGR